MTKQDDWLYQPSFHPAWRRAKLFTLARWINGMAFSGAHFSPTGRPIIKIAELKHGISDQTRFTDAVYDTNYFVRSGDMLFAWSGQPETSIDVTMWRGEEGWLNQHIFKVEAHPEKCSAAYLYFLLKYLKPNFIGIARNKQTTGLGHVTRQDLEHIEVALPSGKVQDAIVHVLGSMDDKIVLLRKINYTLEEMTHALFKSWFVDFDPVRAKAEGRETGLPTNIARLFPDSLVNSELGEIPLGWEVTSLGDLASFEYGKPLKGTDRREGSIPVYGSGGLIGYHDTFLVAGPGIVVGRKGNPGIVTWVPTDFYPIDTTFYVVPTNRCNSLHFIYWALRTHDLAGLSADSAVPGLNRNHAYMNRQLLPPAAMVDRFEQIARVLAQRALLNADQSQTLDRLLDTVLPPLISGNIQIDTVDKATLPK